MAQAWYQYTISQRYGQNGEQGIDLATPFHTPITALYAGVVRWAGRTQWGCGSSGGIVTITGTVPELGVATSYYLHLDEAYVKSGDQVQAGQVIGLSGGQLSGGQWPVVNCPNKGLIYSTGAHTEFGFNASFVSGPGKNVDPLFAITQARNGTLPNTTPSGVSTLSYNGTAGAGGTPGTLVMDPGLLSSGLLQFYHLTSVTHRVIHQPTGFDGMCEALDQAEQFADWNWENIPGTLAADFKPWLIRAGVATIAFFIAVFVLWEWIHAPVQGAVNFAGRVATSALAPEAAPAVAAMQSAPTATAK